MADPQVRAARMSAGVVGDRAAEIRTARQLAEQTAKRAQRSAAANKWARAFVVTTGMDVLRAWCLMSSVAIVHTYWLPSIPTVGYLTSFAVLWLLRFALSGMIGSRARASGRK